jgi:hypothetical protein
VNSSEVDQVCIGEVKKLQGVATRGHSYGEGGKKKANDPDDAKRHVCG